MPFSLRRTTRLPIKSQTLTIHLLIENGLAMTLNYLVTLISLITCCTTCVLVHCVLVPQFTLIKNIPLRWTQVYPTLSKSIVITIQLHVRNRFSWTMIWGQVNSPHCSLNVSMTFKFKFFLKIWVHQNAFCWQLLHFGQADEQYAGFTNVKIIN